MDATKTAATDLLDRIEKAYSVSSRIQRLQEALEIADQIDDADPLAFPAIYQLMRLAQAAEADIHVEGNYVDGGGNLPSVQIRNRLDGLAVIKLWPESYRPFHSESR